MKRSLPKIPTRLLAPVAGAFSLGVTGQADDDRDALIEDAIFVLEQNCIACHNADDAKGEIVLDREPLGVNDPAMIVEVISGSDPEMPKDADPLLDEEIEILKKWITKTGGELPEGRILEKPE